MLHQKDICLEEYIEDKWFTATSKKCLYISGFQAISIHADKIENSIIRFGDLTPTFRRSIIKKIHFLDMFPQAFNDGDMIRHQFTLDEFQAT